MSASDARLDVWLWRARFFKTRTQAGRAVTEAGVLLHRDGASRRVAKPAYALAPGDGLTFVAGSALRSVRVLALAPRRGPSAEAQLLYEDIAAALDDGEQGAHVPPTAEDGEEQ